LIITGARLGYLRGCRPVFLAGLGIFGAASLVYGLAPTAGARDRAGRPPAGPPPGATRPALREASPRRHR